MDELREAVPQSCVKCRRRKAKCDRGEPCSNCQRTASECTYETIVRTPLTRKHLTEVEKELAKTKELLRQAETRASTQVVTDQSNPRKRRAASSANDLGGNFYSPVPASIQDHQQYAPSDTTYTANTSAMMASVSQPPYPDYSAFQQRQQRLPAHRASTSHTGPSPTFSMETPPAGDFDWDERVRNNNRFIDGMASLTERSSRGYMGVASGAALLRLADDASADSGLEVENGQTETANHTPPIPALL